MSVSGFGSFLRFPWYVLPVLLSVTITGTAQAATTGTQTFKAAITTGTCSIPGSQMTQTIDFATIARLSTWTGTDDEAITVGVPVVSRKIHFNITGCPAAITYAVMEVDFNPYSDEHPGWIKNAGSAQGLAMTVTDNEGNTLTCEGDGLISDLPVANGATTINGVVHIVRIARKEKVSSGSVSGQVNLTLATF